MVDMIIKTLLTDGHAAFHAYDVLSATQLAIGLEVCDLVISNTKLEGADGVELYLANLGRSTPEIEAQLPADIPILREPFTVENLRGTVAAMLDGKGGWGPPLDGVGPAREKGVAR